MSEQHHPSEKGRDHRFGQGACHLHGHDHLALDAQAFRRACSCFDLGRYFYDIPAIWVDLDQHRQPVRTPALSGWALPENWRKGMRPQGKNGNGQANAGSQAARPNGGSKDHHRPPNSNGGYRQDQTEKANGSRSAVQGDTLDERILSLKKAVGAGLYRNILRDYGRVPVLNQDTAECYVIPPSPPAITYAGLPLDAIEDALQRSVAMQSARGILVRKQQKMTGRPVTPLHEEHVGLLACSGMLNGFFGEGEMRHIAH